MLLKCKKSQINWKLTYSPETIRKLCLSAKFPHQEIRWNYGIFRSVSVSRDQRKWFENIFAYLGVLDYFLLLKNPQKSVIDLQFSERLSLNNSDTISKKDKHSLLFGPIRPFQELILSKFKLIFNPNLLPEDDVRAILPIFSLKLYDKVLAK